MARQSRSALLTVSFVNIWRSFPFYTISLLAALLSVPREIIESAAIDGAGPFRRFVYIIIPQLKIVSLTLIFIHIIWTAINFDFIWIMTQGGPYNSSETLPIMIYRYAIEDFDVGAASALAMMTMGFMLAVFFVYWYAASARGKGGVMVTSGFERASRARDLRGAGAFAVFCIFPFLWMLDTSLKPPDEVRPAIRPSGSSIRRSRTSITW